MAKTRRKVPVAPGKILAAAVSYVIIFLLITLMTLCVQFVLVWELLQSFTLFRNTLESMMILVATIYLVGHLLSGIGVDPRMEQTQRRLLVTLLATFIRYLILSLLVLFITFCYQIVILLKILQRFTFIQNLYNSTKRCSRCHFAVCQTPPQLSSTQVKVGCGFTVMGLLSISKQNA